MSTAVKTLVLLEPVAGVVHVSTIQRDPYLAKIPDIALRKRSISVHESLRCLRFLLTVTDVKTMTSAIDQLHGIAK